MYTHLTISVEYDGTGDTKKRRHVIIDHVISYLQDYSSIDKLTVYNNSLHQSLLYDKKRADYHYTEIGDLSDISLSCKSLGEELIQELQEQLSIQLPDRTISVTFNPLLLSDIYNYLEPGTTFKAMQDFFGPQASGDYSLKINRTEHIVQDLNGRSINLLAEKEFGDDAVREDEVSETATCYPSWEFIDQSKILSTYIQMQDVARNPESTLYVGFDYVSEIPAALIFFYQIHRDLIPKTVFVTFVRSEIWHGRANHVPYAVGLGTGERNDTYERTIYEVATILYNKRSFLTCDDSSQIGCAFESALPKEVDVTETVELALPKEVDVTATVELALPKEVDLTATVELALSKEVEVTETVTSGNDQLPANLSANLGIFALSAKEITKWLHLDELDAEVSGFRLGDD